MQEMREKLIGIKWAFREVRLRRFVSRRSSEASRREVSRGRSAEGGQQREVSRGGQQRRSAEGGKAGKEEGRKGGPG